MTVTITLIAITSFISIVALYIDQRILEKGMLRPFRTIKNGTWYEVITSGFLHGSLGHLLVNMFVLFFFGIVVEQTLGINHYLALYFTGLAFSAIPSLLRHRDNPNYATLGASGAVESVLFGYIFLYPTEKIIIILLPIPIPAWIFGLMFLLYSVFESKRKAGNVNHEAHIAGALWGVLYLLFFVSNSLDHVLTLFGLI